MSLLYICRYFQRKMTINFFKYQGTGNDFVIIDNRDQLVSKNDTKTIARICDRKFGVGGDGLILLEQSDDASEDFKMVYFNADGNESTMCGNGGRCLVRFAEYLGIIKEKAIFSAIDGQHEAIVTADDVSLKMQDVDAVQLHEGYVFLDTGSPHHVKMTEDIENLDVKSKGSQIRYSNLYGDAGSNVNFVEKQDDNCFKVRTYERGVEDETLSCGTGVTAVAIAVHATNETHSQTITLSTPGGKLQVSFEPATRGYRDIWLKGPAMQVFKGQIKW